MSRLARLPTWPKSRSCSQRHRSRSIRGDTDGYFTIYGSELPSPHHSAVRVVSAYERIVACPRLCTGDDVSLRASDNIHSSSIGSDTQRFILSARSELSRPHNVPVGVILSNEGVRATCGGL